MDTSELVVTLVASLLSFVLGWLKKKPGYSKGKNILAAVSKAVEDDTVTAEEARKIKELL